ncbi:thymidine phosphorylase family protein [Ketobacter alkanivorans]|jgi:thymidine phosphorylase|uniref:Putative thymidine phosphorylase n=1 Tax=Ketobacter alkanivorans TaxID=1917421 RepID=A0A2K9LJX2_9GAMM|nr:thymidine phosphorylase family protein [Ketobacter alkanivorans]MAR91867.1 thymidine phosphorylase [Pseudomonadales bacterium]HAG95972.1 thymidine phosphorylase family protein [Gammaproteobacteria bacterium]AUM11074.1 thymidine phosphorylase [Ketobacter alkanivorans]MAR93391.1 thymidine phosphorylase [Pseudomonadales bacterium]HAU16401.1 thymidine phosphorylase family protein [Gammaproteobacteria bacterium]|tara:strand:+ start:9617 stop:11125 length:1509 start_codon:yes stop_codon:yes gene_type:complete
MRYGNTLKVLDIGIDTHQEPIVYMRADCNICRSEGFTANSRVLLIYNTNRVIATINVVDEKVLAPGSAGLSKIAMERLGVATGDSISVSYAPVVNSLGAVRKKIFGHKLSDKEIGAVIKDISAHRYTDIEIASFLSVCAGSRLDVDEIIALTQAMVACGKRLTWPGTAMVLDKHCIGGLPGNRTTPLVVSMVSAAGLTIPKTSSRAITSPAGTADTMESLTNVNLDLARIQEVVAETHACLVWGGAVNLSPADDLLIRIERALDLDGEGQLIASVLSKKIAAGSTHAVIDIPKGPTAKVRTHKDAERLASLFTQVGAACGVHIRCLITDGIQPVGEGIGPVEEARDVLAVLQRADTAPKDLRERALIIAAQLFSMADDISYPRGLIKATDILDSGKAWTQFQRIMKAQGGLKPLPEAYYQHTETARTTGVLQGIDNRRLARLAKLAGAPATAAAGLRLHKRVGETIHEGDALFTLYSDTEGERQYALAYYQQTDIFSIGETS